MALFRRQRVDTDIPELKEYYAARRSNNSASAWALALLSLAITVAVIMGAFFGGRWAWRKLKGSEKVNQVATTAKNETKQAADSEEGVVSDEGGVSTTIEEQAAKKAAEAEAAAKATEAESAKRAAEAAAVAKKAQEEAAAKAAAASQAVASSIPSTVTTTVPTEGKLPNNGPGDVVVIFLGTTVVGYFISRKKLVKNL